MKTVAVFDKANKCTGNSVPECILSASLDDKRVASIYTTGHGREIFCALGVNQIFWTDHGFLLIHWYAKNVFLYSKVLLVWFDYVVFGIAINRCSADSGVTKYMSNRFWSHMARDMLAMSQQCSQCWLLWKYYIFPLISMIIRPKMMILCYLVQLKNFVRVLLK